MFKKLLTMFILCMMAGSALADGGMPYLGVNLNLYRADGFTGLVPTWYGGYGTTFGCTTLYFAAGEGYIEIPSVPVSGSQANRILYDFGLSGLLGVYVMPCNLFYMRLGLQTSQIKKFDAFHTGTTIGLGVQFPWDARWDIRGEYLYVGQGVISNFFSMQSSNFKLGIVYKFY